MSHATVKVGTTLRNPVSGESLHVQETHASSDGGRLRMRLSALPGRAVPPAHVHPAAAETFSVVSGHLAVRLGRTWRTLGPGEEATAPPGVTHAYRVEGDEPAVVTVTLVPPGDLEGFLAGVYGLAEAGRTTRAGQLHLLDVAPLFAAHAEDVVAAGLPRRFQRVLWPALATVARRRAGSISA